MRPTPTLDRTPPMLTELWNLLLTPDGFVIAACGFLIPILRPEWFGVHFDDDADTGTEG